MLLYHVSDTPGIRLFEPRPAPDGLDRPMDSLVWAIEERLLHNYLLPRECPRVTFYAGPESDPVDVERLMAGSSARHVVAIESRWLPEILKSRLTLYTFPADTFEGIDSCAGYFVSRVAVEPLREETLEDVPGALLARDVELRVMPSLWKLRDLVVGSTLQFSIVRFRSAAPRPD